MGCPKIARARERVVGVQGPGLYGLTATLDNIRTIAVAQGQSTTMPETCHLIAKRIAHHALGHRRCYSGSKHRNARLSLERFWFPER